MSYIYQEQRVQPCHLSSSIYYGGQDVYSRPQSARDSGLNTMVIAFINIICVYNMSDIV